MWGVQFVVWCAGGGGTSYQGNKSASAEAQKERSERPAGCSQVAWSSELAHLEMEAVQGAVMSRSPPPGS